MVAYLHYGIPIGLENGDLPKTSSMPRQQTSVECLAIQTAGPVSEEMMKRQSTHLWEH
jgi:hypothetical protein